MNDRPIGEASESSRSLLGLFLGFLRRPRYSEQPTFRQNLKVTLIEVLRVYSLAIAFLLPLLVIISVVTSALGATEHPIGDLIKTMPVSILVLMVVILGPLIEELIFRLPLRYSPLNISLPLAFIILAAPVTLGAPPEQAAGVRFGLAIVVGLGTRFILHHWVGRDRGHAVYAKIIGVLIYGSAVVFGAIHIFNFDPKTFFIAPLVVMPQLTLGFFLAFIRLRHGFGWAVFNHSLHNFLVLFPYLLTQLGSTALREKGFSSATASALTSTDYILVAFMLLFLGVGLLLCLRSVLQILKEWRLERRVMVR